MFWWECILISLAPSKRCFFCIFILYCEFVAKSLHFPWDMKTSTWKCVSLISQIYFVSRVTMVALNLMLLVIIFCVLLYRFWLSKLNLLLTSKLEEGDKDLKLLVQLCHIIWKIVWFLHLELFMFYFSYQKILPFPKDIDFFSEYSTIYLCNNWTNAIIQGKVPHFVSSLNVRWIGGKNHVTELWIY